MRQMHLFVRRMCSLSTHKALGSLVLLIQMGTCLTLAQMSLLCLTEDIFTDTYSLCVCVVLR